MKRLGAAVAFAFHVLATACGSADHATPPAKSSPDHAAPAAKKLALAGLAQGLEPTMSLSIDTTTSVDGFGVLTTAPFSTAASNERYDRELWIGVN